MIILTQQMHQIKNIPFQSLLTQIRKSKLNSDDCEQLNKKVLQNFANIDTESTTVIVTHNETQ